MKLHKIEAGLFHCDGGAIFGVVPKRVWQKRYPCNEDNFCTLSMRCLLADTGTRRILIDTGCGDKQLDYLKYFDIRQGIRFEPELNRLRYTCADITDVVLTHLHFDHCGGCTYYINKEKGELALAFPNATHWVGAAQWENYLHPNVREGNSYFEENMRPVEQAGRLRLVHQDEWLCPEIELRLYDGHTPGQLCPYLHAAEGTYVYTGDIIPLAASLPLAWVSAYDVEPLRSMTAKERLLCEAADKGQILFFEHDATTECGTVQKVNGRYRFTPCPPMPPTGSVPAARASHSR